MELLRGKELADAYDQFETVDLASKVHIAQQIAAALEHANGQGIVHRDVKPENIFLTPSGRVKLMDFGIARAGSSNLTKAGMSLGTPAYMSPEQIRGQPATELADVYSYGMVLYEMFAGVRVYRKDNLEQVLYAALFEPLNPANLWQKGVTPDLIKLIMACGAKDASRRPSGFGAIGVTLAQIAARIPVAPKAVVPLGTTPESSILLPPTPAPLPPTAPANLPVAWVAAAIGGFLVLVILVSALIIFLRKPALTLTTPTGEMALIPAGTFRYGPNAEERMVPAFYIDRNEVTNGSYALFTKATGHAAPPGLESANPGLPVANVSFEDASAFAKWAEKRLPRFDEWEKAARGTDGRIYPWGNVAEPGKAVVQGGDFTGPVAANSLPAGASPFGALHMAGNVWEWVAQPAEPSPALREAFTNRLTPPLQPSDGWVHIRGGSFREPLQSNVLVGSVTVPGRYTHASIGFRCAKNAK
jgi:serine/threonine-protein kinase